MECAYRSFNANLDADRVFDGAMARHETRSIAIFVSSSRRHRTGHLRKRNNRTVVSLC